MMTRVLPIFLALAILSGCRLNDDLDVASNDVTSPSETVVDVQGSVLYVPYGCAFYDEVRGDSVLIEMPSEEAVQAVSDVVGYTGLPQNFEIYSANIENAIATVVEARRIIIYDPGLIELVRSSGTSHWSAVSIFAHEVGHHLSGHLGQSSLDPILELEADRFSGHVLYRMGASLEEAQLAMNTLAIEQDSPTHPGRSRRLEAIVDGWQSAASQFGTEATPPPPPPIEEPSVLDLPVQDENPEPPLGCYPSEPVRAVVFSIEGLGPPLAQTLYVILELEDGTRGLWNLDRSEMSRADMSWLPTVLLPGRRVIVHFVNCGNGPIRMITRIRVRQ